jgi:hypothetical protein
MYLIRFDPVRQEFCGLMIALLDFIPQGDKGRWQRLFEYSRSSHLILHSSGMGGKYPILTNMSRHFFNFFNLLDSHMAINEMQ